MRGGSFWSPDSQMSRLWTAAAWYPPRNARTPREPSFVTTWTNRKQTDPKGKLFHAILYDDAPVFIPLFTFDSCISISILFLSDFHLMSLVIAFYAVRPLFYFRLNVNDTAKWRHLNHLNFNISKFYLELCRE